MPAEFFFPIRPERSAWNRTSLRGCGRSLPNTPYFVVRGGTAAVELGVIAESNFGSTGFKEGCVIVEIASASSHSVQSYTITYPDRGSNVADRYTTHPRQIIITAAMTISRILVSL